MVSAVKGSTAACAQIWSCGPTRVPLLVLRILRNTTAAESGGTKWFSTGVEIESLGTKHKTSVNITLKTLFGISI